MKDDLISRQVAIDRIDAIVPGKTDSDYQKGIAVGMAMAKVAIREQDSAEPEQRWIPCSERLPEPYEYCLWTTVDGRVVYHHCDGLFSKYIAWMSLPEPYKGGENG